MNNFFFYIINKAVFIVASMSCFKCRQSPLMIFDFGFQLNMING